MPLNPHLEPETTKEIRLALKDIQGMRGSVIGDTLMMSRYHPSAGEFARLTITPVEGSEPLIEGYGKHPDYLGWELMDAFVDFTDGLERHDAKHLYKALSNWLAS